MKKSNYKNNLLKKTLLVTVGLFAFPEAYAQVGIGTITPNESSQLDIVATDKGVLIPRVNLTKSTDTATITKGNVTGLLVFNTNVAEDVVQGFYYWDGTKWVRMVTSVTNTAGLNSSAGAPTATSPANAKAGDVYVNSVNGDIYTYNGKDWVIKNGVSTNPNNILVNGTDGQAYLTKSTLNGLLGVNTGTGVPVVTPETKQNPGDIYVNSTNGDIYTYNGTNWVKQSGTGAGAGVSTDANNALTNGKDGLPFLSKAAIAGSTGVSSGTNPPTATDPAGATIGNTYIDGNGNVYTFTPTGWRKVSNTFAGAGVPTAATTAGATAGDLYIDSTTKEISIYDGTTWQKQNIVSKDANNAIKNGTDGLAFLSQSAIAGATGVSSGTNPPTATDPAGAAIGNTYIDGNGNVYTFTPTGWRKVSNTFAGAGVPTAATTAGATAGDVYIDSTTKEISIYDGTNWQKQNTVSKDANNAIKNGTDGLAFLSQSAIAGATGISSGTNPPTATDPAGAAIGNTYIDGNGNVYTFTATGWRKVSNTFAGAGAPTAATTAGATAGDLYIDSTTKEISIYDGKDWQKQNVVSKDANNIIKNGADGLAFLSQASLAGALGIITGIGAPTNTTPPNPVLGNIYLDAKDGGIYTYDGAKWKNVIILSSGTGEPTAANPLNPEAGNVYVNKTNGDVYTYNGGVWENQSGVSKDANNALMRGTDGLAFLNQAAIKGASGVSSGVGLPTNETVPNPAQGNIYVNSTTGDIYTYSGTAWTNVTTTSTGAGAPTTTAPANAIKGDVYVDGNNGDIYTYNGTAWEKQSGVSGNTGNVLVNGTDGLAFLNQAAIKGASGVSSGVGLPTNETAPNPAQGNVYVNSTTGDIYTFSGTAWTNVTNTSTGAGAPTTTAPANAIKGDIYVDGNNGDIYTYNGIAWENQSGVSANTGNLLVNGTDGLAFLNQAAIKGASGVNSGAGLPTGTTAPNPVQGNIYVNSNTGDIYTYSGTAWTNVTTSSTGAGAPTTTAPANAIKGDVYIDGNNGDIYTYNGTNWEKQSGVSTDAGNLLSNGTDGLAFLNKAAIEGTIGVSSGTGVPTIATAPAPKVGDIYVNESNGDIYTYSGTTWTNVTTTSSGTAAPTATVPAGALSGDIYVETTTGKIYSYDGTRWINSSAASTAAVSGPSTSPGNILTAGGDGLSFLSQAQLNAATTATVSGVSTNPGNVLINGTDGRAFLSDARVKGAAGISSGAGIPTTVTAPNPVVGNVYVNSQTGDIYTYSGTAWTNVTMTSTGAGAPTTTTPAGAMRGDVYVDGNNGDIYTYNGTTWENQSGVSTDAGNLLTKGTDGLPLLSQVNVKEPWNEAGTTNAATTNTQNIYLLGNIGVGLNNPTSTLHVAGAIATPIISTNANITLNNTHSVVRIDTTTGNKAVTLPLAAIANGRMYTVVKTDPSSNSITFNSTIVAGGFTFTQANVQTTYHLQSDGTNWLLLN